jgi:hypothetical protein
MNSIINIPVSSLKGIVNSFEVPFDMKVGDFKKIVYDQHNDITRPFPLEQIDKIDIQLTLGGKILTDEDLVSHRVCDGEDTLYISVKSKPINITAKDYNTPTVHSYFDDYTPSPTKPNDNPTWYQTDVINNDDSLCLIEKSLIRISKEIQDLSQQVKKIRNTVYSRPS